MQITGCGCVTDKFYIVWLHNIVQLHNRSEFETSSLKIFGNICGTRTPGGNIILCKECLAKNGLIW